jgi:hypothetical protein
MILLLGFVKLIKECFAPGKYPYNRLEAKKERHQIRKELEFDDPMSQDVPGAKKS